MNVTFESLQENLGVLEQLQAGDQGAIVNLQAQHGLESVSMEAEDSPSRFSKMIAFVKNLIKTIFAKLKSLYRRFKLWLSGKFQKIKTKAKATLERLKPAAKSATYTVDKDDDWGFEIIQILNGKTDFGCIWDSSADGFLWNLANLRTVPWRDGDENRVMMRQFIQLFHDSIFFMAAIMHEAPLDYSPLKEGTVLDESTMLTMWRTGSDVKPFRDILDDSRARKPNTRYVDEVTFTPQHASEILNRILRSSDSSLKTCEQILANAEIAIKRAEQRINNSENGRPGSDGPETIVYERILIDNLNYLLNANAEGMRIRAHVAEKTIGMIQRSFKFELVEEEVVFPNEL